MSLSTAPSEPAILYMVGLVSTIPCTCCRVEVIKKICPFQRVAQTQQFGGDLMPGQLFVIIVPSLFRSHTHTLYLSLSLSDILSLSNVWHYV